MDKDEDKKKSREEEDRNRKKKGQQCGRIVAIMLARDKDRARTGSTNLNGWSSDRLGASHESEGKWENGGMRTIKCGPNRYLSSSAPVFPRLFLLHQFGRETTKNADGNTKSKNRRILRTKTNETSKTLDTLLSSVQTIRRTILRLCIFDLRHLV